MEKETNLKGKDDREINNRNAKTDEYERVNGERSKRK